MAKSRCKDLSELIGVIHGNLGLPGISSTGVEIKINPQIKRSRFVNVDYSLDVEARRIIDGNPLQNPFAVYSDNVSHSRDDGELDLQGEAREYLKEVGECFEDTGGYTISEKTDDYFTLKN